MKKLLALPLLLTLAAATSSRADSTLTFNEIMYHPANNSGTDEANHEWVELRNQLAVDLDISGWSLRGGIEYAFASNTIVRGGGLIVVAFSPATLTAAGASNVFGPFTGRLANAGDTLQIRNNSGRVVDEVNYGTDGDWPVAPDGSGVSLAKRDRESASEPAENWTVSELTGGTPGAENFVVAGAVPPDTRHVAIDASWKYEASGTDLGTGWREAGYNDAAWASRHFLTNRVIADLFNTGLAANGTPAADGASDPHYILSYTAQGTPGMNAIVTLNHSAWLANDTVSKWISVVNPGTTTINGGGYGYLTRFSLSGFILNTVQITFSVACDNAMTNVFLNGAATGQAFTGFAGFSGPFTLSSGFVGGTNTLEFGTENQGAGPGAFRAQVSGAGLGVNTNSPPPLGPVTYYLRKSFNFVGDPAYTQLRLNAIIADGAIVYLNGVEVFRQNMPAGPPASTSAALSDVTAPGYSGLTQIPAGSLVAGNNVLAVEVHQAAGSADGPLFGADLISTPLPVPATAVPTLAFNEFSASTNAEFWLELMNYGTNDLPLGGYFIVRDGPDSADNFWCDFPPDATLAAGAYLAVTNTMLGFHPVSGDRLYLMNPSQTKVLDAVVVKKPARGRSPNGTGAYASPSAPTPGGPNSFAFRDEIVINEIMYDHRDVPGANGLPAQASRESWTELHNRSAHDVNLTDWEIDGGITYRFFNKTLAAGGYLVVAKDAALLRTLFPAADIVGDFGKNLSGNSDTIRLRDPSGNTADEVRYFGSGRWPEYANGGSSSLELRDPHADNAKAEAWAASVESGASTWQTYSYRMVAGVPSGSGQPTTWNDFIFGLLAGGECLIDDLSVVESPTNNPIQLVGNGTFENGLTGWRVLGTHGRSQVEVDPDNANNHVLHLIATGPQEHMHNHIETTHLGQRAVVNGREYQISYRAKWLAGNNLLNTRLYFNRCARTTALPVPALNGTPGAQNSRYVANIGPTFSQFGHARVIPQPNDPVTVSVVAQDPQGVASCVVWWSANGGAFANAPMASQGGGLYQGTIPGFAAGTIVQFYVRAVDGLGAAATYPADGPASGALYTVADGQANLSLGHNVRIILTPANRDLLHASNNVMSNARLPGTVIYDEQRAYYDMGVRLKGSQRGRPNADRVSFHLEFPPDDPFRGVHPFMLVDRSGAGDSTANKQQEILIKHILLRAGNIPGTQPDLCRVIAPRSAQTGPAQFAPRHEDNFVETAFANGGDGTTWELELIYYPTVTNALGQKWVTSPPPNDAVVGTDIQNLGDDKEIYRYNFILKNHRAADDYSKFIAFAKSVSLLSPQLDQQTKLTMGLDEWMRVWALVTLCGVGDSYTFGNNHNLFMYLRPSDGKIVPFPVDMDFSFNRGTTAALVGDQNISRVISLTPNLRCFYGHILDIINVSYNTSYMNYWVSHYQSFAPGQNYSGVIAYIQARANYAIGIINGAGGNAAFAVTGTNFITTSNNLVTLSGTAPVQVKTIKINGVEYAVTWTSVSAWTLRLPVSAATNVLELVGYDVRGNPLTNLTRTVTVNYTGPALPPPDGAVVINEIMYNPVTPDASYVELFNTSPTVGFDLSGWRVNGLGYTFQPGSVLTNRQFLVLAKSLATYGAVYSNAPLPFAQFDGALQNNGETLTLLRPVGTNGEEVVVDKVRYEAAPPWASGANGRGASLQLIDPAQDNSRAANWSDGAGWRFYSFTGVAGVNATNMLVYLQTAGDLYIDKFSLVLGNVAGLGSNLLQSGSFEGGLAPWNILGNHANSAVTTGIAIDGSNSMHLVSTGAGGTGGSIAQSIPALIAASTYTFSFWFLPSTNNGSVNFRLTSSFRSTSAIDTRPTFATPGAANTVASTLPAFPPLWLNEVQPENLSGPADHTGQREPWLELFNAGTNAVSLAGFYLANNYGNLAQWAFPPGAEIQPGEFKTIFADGEPLQTSNSEWHTSFRLSPASGSVALAWTPGAVQVLDYLNYTNLPAGRSYGAYPDGQPFDRQEFFRATYGGTNDATSAPLVVSINEWVAANNNGLSNTNNANRRDDWFELYNPAATPANLAGYFLTDNLSNQFQVEIPPGYVIPPHGYFLVWADGKPGLNSTNDPDLHVDFKLDQGGEALGLFAADGTQIDAVAFGSQYTDLAEGRFTDGTASVYFLSTPTPRSANAAWANRYPVLAPIADTNAYVGQLLSFTPGASDPDAPPQTLAFSFDGLAPAGAMLDGASGLFTWTPAPVQAPGTNVVSIRVTDNGAPSLSAARTFRIVVRVPLLVSNVLRLPNGDISFTVGTTVGKTYRVEYKDELDDPAWTPLGPDAVATSTTLTITDDTTAPAHRFYRAVQVD